MEATKTKKRILLIDDEPLLLKGLERILETCHSVTAVSDGQEALILIGKSCLEFDVVICDLNMPNVTGADIYRYIAEHYPGREKYIIFMSGGAYTQEMIDFVSSITNKQLEKPFSSLKMLTAIDELF